MGYTDHLEGLLVEREEKIRLLEGHTSAYTARIFLLQNRLLTALDTLNSMQITHAQEISALEEEIARLKEQLHRYSHFLKEAEEERDDMRDAVMKLVEKVETSNDDYSTWPHSQIYLTRLEDPIADFDLKPSKLTSTDDLLSYAASLIEALRRERDNERRSHAHSQATFEARLVVLEAQLSRREAELATCAVHTHHDTVEHLLPEEEAELSHNMVDSDQIISVLDVTVARNKALELEIKSLAKRLENARANQGSSSSRLDKPSQAKTNPAAEVLELSNPDAEHLQTPFPVRQIPSPLPDRDRETRPQGFNIGPSDEGPRHALHELDREVQQLGEKVDAFTQERNNLFQTISTAASDQKIHHSIGEDEKIDLEYRIQVLEEECDRLRKSESNLRNQLERTRAEAHTREAELMEEITTLRFDQDDTERVPVVALLDLDGSDGEMSMELATPLMPMSVMSTSSTPAQDIPIPISRTPSPSTSGPPDVDDEIGHTTPNSEGFSICLSPSSLHTISEPSDIASSISEVISSNDRSPASLPPQLMAEIVEREEAVLINRQRQIEVGEAALGELLELVHELNS